MFEQALNQIREKVRTIDYVMTLHAEEEMNDDGLTIFDVESIILTGGIVERQKDEQTGEWKYLVQGDTEAGDLGVVVTKFSPIGRLVLLTVYLL